MNFQAFLRKDSWEELIRQVRHQAGSGSPMNMELSLITKDGRRVAIAVERRLLFEKGRPVAILDIGTSAAPADERLSPRDHKQTRHSMKSAELAGFAENLKQLHRLSTTTYASLDRAFDDHLKTGCELFDLPVGSVLQVDDGTAVVLSSYGSETLPSGIIIPLDSTHSAPMSNRLRTLTSCVPTGDDKLLPEF